VAGPWEKYQQNGPWTKFAKPAEVAPAEPPPSLGKEMMSAFVRPVVKGVAGVPGIFADGTMSAWNLATGQNNQMPSAALEAELDRFTVKPQGIGKAAEFVSSALVGAKIPVPGVKPTPKPILSPRDLTLAAARKEGYVVPPSTVNPTIGTAFAESVGGKLATAADASVRNQPVTNSLVRRALGIGDDAAINRNALIAIRKSASDAYEKLRGAGEIQADESFAKELGAIAQKYQGASKDFPELAKGEVTDAVASVTKERFSTDSALDAISILRDKSDKAYRGGDNALGSAYKKIAKAMESQIERHLAAQGKESSAMLDAYREARRLIAKTYSVDKALNDATGNVSAAKLANQLGKGEPLSGELETAARFGKAFPKAAREVVDSGSVRNTDIAVSGGLAGLSGQPWYLLYPFGRMATRNALLSNRVQNALVTPWTPSAAPLLGASPGMTELSNYLRE
jgi:hypothetical protein